MKNITLIPVLLSTDDAKNDSVNGLLITNGRLHKPVAGGEYRRCIQNGSTANYLYLTSDAPIKEGDYVECLGNIYKVIIAEKECLYFHDVATKAYRKDCKKIILTTDSKLIAEGVPAIDANTKAIGSCPNCNGKGCELCDGMPYEVNFLSEFCKRWNEKDKKDARTAGFKKSQIVKPKDNQKVDVEKLAEEMTDSNGYAGDEAIAYERGIVAGFEKCQAIQSQAGRFDIEALISWIKKDKSKIEVSDILTQIEVIKKITPLKQAGEFSSEDMKKFGLQKELDVLNKYSHEIGIDAETRMEEILNELKLIQDKCIVKEQPKADIVIECEMEEYTDGNAMYRSHRLFQPRLNKDGQPTLIFK